MVPNEDEIVRADNPEDTPYGTTFQQNMHPRISSWRDDEFNEEISSAFESYHDPLVFLDLIIRCNCGIDVDPMVHLLFVKPRQELWKCLQLNGEVSS